MNPMLKYANLWVKSQIASNRLRKNEGTIITGSVRSGTTLALRIFCTDLTPEEEKDGSLLNEYRPLSNQIIRGQRSKGLLLLPIVMQNRHHLHKSPHIAFLLPHIPPKYRVIITFRDLRLIIPSMFQHETVQRMIISGKMYWSQYTSERVSFDPIMRAIQAAELYYKQALAYRGSVEVWNYGFWDEWQVRNTNVSSLYNRLGETSSEIIKDVAQGNIFSDKSTTLHKWETFCAERKLTAAQKTAVDQANERIYHAYQQRNLKIKFVN